MRVSEQKAQTVKTSCPAPCLPLHSWNRGLRPGETPRGIQLQVPVLSQALGEAGAADRGHPQDWADVSWHLSVSLCTNVPLDFICPGRTGTRASVPRHTLCTFAFNFEGQSRKIQITPTSKIMVMARDSGERRRRKLAAGRATFGEPTSRVFL